MNDRSDRELVAAHVGGDRTALAAIYDRYAPRLYDTAAAMLHDRHEAADATHDVFVTAAAQLHRLREPDRLRAWLFAVLRNEVYRRTKRRSRQRPTEVTAMREPVAREDPGAEGAAVESAELGALVRAAAAGLDARDQLVLELTMRQGLEGADLADALGVSVQQSHVLVHRMRERVQRSVTAFAVARAGRRECDDLDRLLHGWNGSFDVTLRKRIARHVDNCDTCNATSRKLVLPMVGAAPAFALPFGLRARVFNSIAAGSPVRESSYDDRGFPSAASRFSRRAMALAAAVIVLVLLGVGAIAAGFGRTGGDTDVADPSTSTSIDTLDSVAGTVVSPITVAPTAAVAPPSSSAAPGGPTDPTIASTTAPPPVSSSPPPASSSPPPSPTAPTTVTTAPTTVTTAPSTAPVTVAPGRLILSTTTVDLGASARSAQLSLTNPGGRAVVWKLVGNPAPFTVSTASGSLAPGARVDIVISLNRASLAEGDLARVVRVEHDVAGLSPFPVAVVATVEHLPVVTLVRANATVACPWSVNPTVAVQVSDESAISSVVLSWTGPGQPGSASMTAGGGGWIGQLAMQQKGGTWRWTVTATDARGNRGTLSRTIVVNGC